jgi:hypothetical protein
MSRKIIYTFIFVVFLTLVFFTVSKTTSRFFPIAAPTQQEEAIVIKGITYFVSPEGDDTKDGRSKESAFATIQKAVDMLVPGDGVVLGDGTYFQDFATVRDGTEGNLIVIKGSKNAIVKGSGKAVKIVEIRHSYIALTGFTIDGFGAGDGSKKEDYRDKLVYIQGLEPFVGITGLKIIDMNLTNAGGECLRVKYFFHKNEIAHNTISHCGVYDFVFADGGKNGEGIYVGTAPEQVEDNKNPTRDVDASNDNWIHNNTIDTQGNECIDVKEGSSGNIVENNSCTGQKDSESGGLDARGSGNIFQNNEIFGNVGAGIRLGGDTSTDGIGTSIIGNHIYNNGNSGIKIQRNPQKQICGNDITDNVHGDFGGEYGSDNKNTKECKG